MNRIEKILKESRERLLPPGDGSSGTEGDNIRKTKKM
jgi:hypothetical protein